jgi:hypothetical protein
MKLDVHLIQCFLQVLDVNRRRLRQAVAMAKYGTDVADGLLRPEGCPKQANRMQVLQPLTVFDVCFSPRHVLHMAGINKKHLESSGFEQLEEWYPVHACRFHRHRINLAVLQPVSRDVEISGKRRKAA